MIYLLLGKDDFSKKEFAEDLKQKTKAAVFDFFEDSDPKQVLSAASGGSLFDAKKLLRVYGMIFKVDLEKLIEKDRSSENVVLFVEDSLDKRKTETKEILKNKNINVVEFEIPRGELFRKWLIERSKKHELKLSASALQKFMQKLGEIYNLWQADMELHKLKIFAGDREVSGEDVERLVSENIDDDVFKITNAIADKNKKLAMKYLTDYMDRLAGVDEKSKVISLSGILAEQFRGILMIKDFLIASQSDVQIQKNTGFSPGRLFVYKKIASNFPEPKLYDALRKFELLDEEIKTSQSPAALQFLMIISSAMN